MTSILWYPDVVRRMPHDALYHPVDHAKGFQCRFSPVKACM